jgi:DNA-binding response OmpR family regulator
LPCLEGDGFAVDRFDTLASARAALAATPYDLILLDLGMPDGDGVSLIESLRRSKMTIPILILTARDGVGDRVRGLDSGADDYLVKPFAIAELSARCRALLRRPGASLGIVLEDGALTSAIRKPGNKTDQRRTRLLRPMRMRAQRKTLNPSIGRTIRLIAR